MISPTASSAHHRRRRRTPRAAVSSIGMRLRALTEPQGGRMVFASTAIAADHVTGSKLADLKAGDAVRCFVGRRHLLPRFTSGRIESRGAGAVSDHTVRRRSILEPRRGLVVLVPVRPRSRTTAYPASWQAGSSNGTPRPAALARPLLQTTGGCHGWRTRLNLVLVAVITCAFIRAGGLSPTGTAGGSPGFTRGASSGLRPVEDLVALFLACWSAFYVSHPLRGS